MRARRRVISAARAQVLADTLLVEARQGVNKKEYDYWSFEGLPVHPHLVCTTLQGTALSAFSREDVERRCCGARHAGEGPRKGTLPASVWADPHRQWN